MDTEIRREGNAGHFVATLNGDEAQVAFEEAGEDRLDYRSTFVPEEHRHQGLGEQLVLEALEWARDHGYQVIPTCPFVGWVVERNPEFGDLIAS